MAAGCVDRQHVAVATGKKRFAGERQRAELAGHCQRAKLLAGDKPSHAPGVEGCLLLGDGSQAGGGLVQLCGDLGQVVCLVGVDGGLVTLTDRVDRLHQVTLLLGQLGHVCGGLGVTGAVDGVDAFLRGNVGDVFCEYHVDRRETRKLVAPTRAGFAIEGHLAVGALIIVAREQCAFIHHRPRAADLAAGVEEFIELTSALVEQRRHPAAGRHEQAQLGRNNVALRRHPSIIKAPRLVTGGVVEPNLPAAASVHRTDVKPLIRENAGSEIDDALLDQQPGANRPRRDKPAVANHPLATWTRPVFPDKRAVRRVEAVNQAVVRAEIQVAAMRHRRKPHRSTGGKTPPLFRRPGVQRVHVIVHIVAEKQRPPGDHDIVGAIRVHARRLLSRHRPGGARTVARLEHPLRIQLAGNGLRTDRRAIAVMPISRPIGR